MGGYFSQVKRLVQSSTHEELKKKIKQEQEEESPRLEPDFSE